MKLFPLEVTDIAGFICASITVILSIGGGIGPGAILGKRSKSWFYIKFSCALDRFTDIFLLCSCCLHYCNGLPPESRYSIELCYWNGHQHVR